MARSFARRLGDRIVAHTLFGIIGTVGRMPIDRALDFAHSAGRTIGPKTPRHRIVLENLERALPGIPGSERERIGRESWGHQARLLVETAYPERIYDWTPEGTGSRVTVDCAIDFRERHEKRVPTIFFTGHIGCFEFLPFTALTGGLPIATLFRSPSNAVIARRLIQQREPMSGKLIRARRGAAKELATELRAKRSIGVLVDQKFTGGEPVDFFGIPAPTNPLVARIAALNGGELIPARCIRRPDNRYHMEIGSPLRLPRGPNRRIDVTASLKLVTSMVEGWVREHPEQWMWFHRRWG